MWGLEAHCGAGKMDHRVVMEPNVDIKEELRAEAGKDAKVVGSWLGVWLEARGLFFLHNFLDVVFWMLVSVASGYFYARIVSC